MNNTEKIIAWLKDHPAIKITIIEQFAGLPPRTLKHIHTRGIPEHHLPSLIQELKRYGYK